MFTSKYLKRRKNTRLSSCFFLLCLYDCFRFLASALCSIRYKFDRNQLINSRLVIIMEIVLEFERRSRIVKFSRGATEIDLRDSFEKLCDTDPVLRRRSLTHYATFTTLNQRHQRDVELEPGQALSDGLVVKVYFASYAAIVSLHSHSVLSLGT